MEPRKCKIKTQAPVSDVREITKTLSRDEPAIVHCRIGNFVEHVLEDVHADEEANASQDERGQQP